MRKTMKKKIIMKDIDYEILKMLYKVEFLKEVQISALTGENREYIKGRLKKMKNSGLIGRKVICEHAVNWITKQGIREVNLKERNVREPSIGRYAHALGCVDCYTWLSLRRTMKDGSIRGYTDFGKIISERDFNAARELRQAGTRPDGQPIYEDLSKDIHAPDGYFKGGDHMYAIEYERTRKSKKEIVRKNMIENSRRFYQQLWFYDDPGVGKTLKELQAEIGRDKILLYDLRVIREDISKLVDSLPKVISEKSGKPRISCFGPRMANPLPLYKLPVIMSEPLKMELERREIKDLGTNNVASCSKEKMLLERRA